MASTRAPASSLRLVPLLHFFLLVILSHQGHSQDSQSLPSSGNAALNTPSYEELSSALVVNQLALLQMIEGAANSSCAAAETSRQKEARLEEALRQHQERVVEAVEAGQQRRSQEVLEAIQTTVQDTFTKLREDMQQEINRIREELPEPEEEAAPPQDTKDVEMPLYYASLVHNDTLPSMCDGNKNLVGSIGTLEVKKEGNYDNNLVCSWNITLPVKAPLKLTWDYISLESDSSCSYDWVKVVDLSNGGTHVYGNNGLCHRISSSMLSKLNMVLLPTKNILVSFHSDGSNQYRGFRLHYQVQVN